jgi:hypothetical protein
MINDYIQEGHKLDFLKNKNNLSNYLLAPLVRD